ncbi:hypothetical protein [Lactiplantibacillus plantarum]|uniref:hypothetical protein n=1 Tax=Lactiplantibacillus plantarum TaxID=1590 RepID=UPI0009777202|nr:hypothetical protein [Lactiplantibacillus plantarum]
MKINVTFLVTIMTVLGTLLGIVIKSALDHFFDEKMRKRELSDKLTMDQFNRLVDNLAKLVEKCKVQIQEEQYTLHEGYWKSKKMTDLELKVAKSNVEERSSEIIGLKEVCTSASYFLPNDGGKVRIKLNEITNIIDDEIQDYYNKHVVFSDEGDKLLNKLNLIRQECLILMHDSILVS